MPESPKYGFGSDRSVSIHDIVPLQPAIRLTRNEADYLALYNDIKINGQRVPIKARPHPDTTLRAQGKLEALDGMGRLQALLELGKQEIKADIEDLTDEQAFETAFTLNINRENLSPLSIANWLNFLRIRLGYTQEKLAEKAGRSQAWVSRHLSMLPQEEPEQQTLMQEAPPVPPTERQSRVLRRAPEEIRREVMLEATGMGVFPSSRDIERRLKADFTPEQVLSKYIGRPNIDDEFLVYTLQEDAGLTLTEAKQHVADFRAPKRSDTGPKFNLDKPNVWTKLSQYYPTEIIDLVLTVTNSDNLETLIKYCRRFTQKLFLKAPESLRQAALEDFTG